MLFRSKPGEAVSFDWLMMETTSFVSRISRRINRLARIYLAGQVPEELHAELQSRVGDVAFLTAGIEMNEWNLKLSDLPEMVTPVGLALSGLEKSGRKRLNLIPPVKRLIGGTPSLAATAVLAFLCLIVGLGWFTQGYFQEKVLLSQVERQLQVMQKEVDEVFRLREEVQVKQQEVETLKNLMSNRQLTLIVLKELSERVPEDSYFRTFKISGNEIEIQGTGSRASSLVPIIAESPYLDEVKINWIRADSRDAGKERFSFSATIEGAAKEAE